MLGFSPFKKRANKFSYIPRYYDPQKEVRDQRRAELSGQRPSDADKEYVPGQFIRTRRDAREEHRDRRSQRSQNRIWLMVGAAAVLIVFVFILYPRIVRFFDDSVQRPKVEATDDFDPNRPIRMVPNDYKK